MEKQQTILARNKTFETFKNKVDGFTEKQVDEFLFDNYPENALGDNSLEEKKKFILDVEYNYIMQASENDLKTIYR